MRTTVTLDPDVAAAIAELRKRRTMGLSEAVNTLVRAGLALAPTLKPFEQTSEPLGLKIDVANVAEALELLEGPAHR